MSPVTLGKPIALEYFVIGWIFNELFHDILLEKKEKYELLDSSILNELVTS